MPALAVTPPPEAPAEARFGWIGKIPGAGDFVRGGLSPRFARAWDEWLQGALTDARAALGDGFRDAYFAAPIRRFALPPGACGPRGAVGILMPSVDRVGREFPLCLAAETDLAAACAYRAAGPLWDELESLALAMLNLDATPDLLREGLAEMTLPGPGAPGPEAPAADPAASIWVAREGGRDRALVVRGMPEGAAAAALFSVPAPGSGAAWA